VIAGLTMLLRPHRNRVRIAELDSGQPVDDVDVILYDAFVHTAVLPDFATSTVPAVVWTFTETPAAVAHSLALGAAGFVSKRLPAPRLVDAIERIHTGEKVVEMATQPTASDDPRGWPGLGVSLSARESETLALICLGLSNQEIADKSYLSINSVKTYVRSCYKKIGVSDRAGAVLWGVRHGLSRGRRRSPRRADNGMSLLRSSSRDRA
jgi:DNA-binding NarL/FixJ family response regulator